jgi:hypothetical protein
VKEGTIGNVRILDTAVLPYEPVFPKKGSTLALSAVLGLAVGVALAFVKQALSNGVTDPDVVERETGLSVFASVPRSEREIALMRRIGKRVPAPVLTDTDPDDLAIESMRSLRTSLQFALVDAPSRILTILGTSPGVGKTFISVNLAYVLAEQGKRVVLVDADLRKGRLHKYLDGKRENGLSEVIAGTLPLDSAIRQTAGAARRNARVARDRTRDEAPRAGRGACARHRDERHAHGHGVPAVLLLLLPVQARPDGVGGAGLSVPALEALVYRAGDGAPASAWGSRDVD